MHDLEPSEVEGALTVLKQYYHELVRHMAEEILRRANVFEGASLSYADDLLEQFASRLNRLGTVHGHLCRFGSCEKPSGTAPLATNEFRCFGCGGVIRHEDLECPLCGWNWK